MILLCYINCYLFTIYFTIEVGGGRILSQSHITGPDPDSNYHLSLAVNGHLTSVQTLLWSLYSALLMEISIVGDDNTE